MNTPYVLLNGIWHKIHNIDTTGLVRFFCGIETSEKNNPPSVQRPTICPGCEKEFPASSLVSTHMANLRLWKTAIACASTEDKREEILKFHKLAVDAARSMGWAEARLANEHEEYPWNDRQ